MAPDAAPIFPDDLYATQEEAGGAAPQPMPPRKPVAPFRFLKHAARPPIPMPSERVKLPDADLPLFTPQVEPGIATAQGLLERCRQYLSAADVEKIREAYRYADSAHLGQFRKSGEPYITHPIAVATILASWKMDAETVEAGLMHDVLEDTGRSKREMAERFGTDVAELVDGVSKLDKLRFSSNEIAQAESFRKMLLAMSRDVRVILVKLADRVHNMRTLGVMRPEKKARIARETLDIYVPIAHRLGLNNVFRELQELSFANRYPYRYKVLYANVLRKRESRRTILERILNETKASLAKAGIHSRILGRDKTIYGIYNKMREKHQSFSDALDIYGFRVVVRSLDDCYLTLGALHRLYKPVHARFKDFIAIPKSNGYQSLHTTVIGPDGTPIEYQIRTEATRTAFSSTGSTARTSTKGDCSPARPPGSRIFSKFSAPVRTAPNFLKTSRSTSSRTASTSSRRAERSSRCRRGRPRSTSPTKFTRTSATTPSPPASTERSSRSSRRSRTATWFRSKRGPTRTRCRNGSRRSARDARARKSANTCATASRPNRSASANRRSGPSRRKSTSTSPSCPRR